METKFPMRNEVEKEMGIIEEETSDEDNSSKDGNASDKERKSKTKSPKMKNKEKRGFEVGELTEINTKDNTPTISKDPQSHTFPSKLQAEKRSKNPSDKTEEEKLPSNLLSNSFNDIRDSYDYIRQHRSSSCKSAAASLQFPKNRYLSKKVMTNPLMPLIKRSHRFSTSSAKRKTHMPSLFGLGNRKMSEPSLVDNLRRAESNSKCLSDISWNVTFKESDTKNSVPLNR